MDSLLMCGGRGTRFVASVEKPLFEIDDCPMVDRVLTALAGSRIDRIYPVVSPHVPNTRDHLAEHPAVDGFLETAGEGYVEDLGTALADDRVGRPVLTVVADLPLLTAPLVDRQIEQYDGRDLTVTVPTALKSALDVSTDPVRSHGGRELATTGLNVVGEADDPVLDSSPEPDRANRIEEKVTGHEGTEKGTEVLLVTYDARLAVNVNTRADAEVAEVLANGS